MIASSPATIEIAPAAIRIQPLLRALASGSGAVSMAMARRLPPERRRGNGARRCPWLQACLPGELADRGPALRGHGLEGPQLPLAARPHHDRRALRDLVPHAGQVRERLGDDQAVALLHLG